MTLKIELGFTDIGSGAPFFTIGDATRGIIGSTDFLIGGGELFVDVTEYLQSLSIARGKSRELDRFNAGQLTASFINNQRFFDPTYPDSPFFGQIVPKRGVRVSYNNVVQFTGVVDDWNITYDPSGFSISTLVAFDVFTQLSNISLFEFEPNQELSGARINAALDNVGWSSDLRDIGVGSEIMEEQIVSDGTTLLDYLTVVEQSEIGFLFIDKNGFVKFVDRAGGYSLSPAVFSDSGSGIPYINTLVNYGSELLYNEITLTSSAGTATAESQESKAFYGARELQRNTFLYNEATLQKIAEGLLVKYKEPEYRFAAVEIDLDSLSPSDRTAVANLEMGDIVNIEFTPSDIPPAVSRVARIISINQTHQPLESRMIIGFESVTGVPLIIGSSAFGIIGVGTIGF